MARQLFHFMAGEQHLQFESSTVLDAWLRLERYAQKQPIASEFRALPIQAFDADGNSIAVYKWDGWHAELLRDTYGDDYNTLLDHAASLLR